MSEIINVPLADLTPSKNQVRKVGTKKDYLDLIASMDDVGLIQPITIRELKNGKYETIVGHRRAKAAEYLGWTGIAAYVTAVANPVADEMRVVENMHRKSLSPVEEGREIAVLLKKHSPKEVGHMLNMTLPQIARRQKLSTLSKEWQKLIQNPVDGIDVTRWPTTSLEEIARLPESLQNEIIGFLKAGPELALITTSELRNLIEHQFLLNLDRVSWDLSEVGIAGKLPCNICPMRANCQESLFDDLDGDNKCLDKSCFKEKTEAVKTQMADLAIERHGEEITLIDEDVPYAVEGSQFSGRYDFEKCKKSDPGARRAVYISGDKAGKPIWVNTGESPKTDDKKGPIDDSERLARVEKKRAKFVTECMVLMLTEPDSLVKPDLTDHDTAIALTSFVAVFGVATGADPRVSWHDESSWSHAYVRSDENPSVSKEWCEIFEEVEADGLVLMNTIWNQVRMVLADHFEHLVKYGPSLHEVEFCLGLIKLGDLYDGWYETAVQSVAMPKALAKKYDKYGVKLDGIG